MVSRPVIGWASARPPPIIEGSGDGATAVWWALIHAVSFSFAVGVARPHPSDRHAREPNYYVPDGARCLQSFRACAGSSEGRRVSPNVRWRVKGCWAIMDCAVEREEAIQASRLATLVVIRVDVKDTAGLVEQARSSFSNSARVQRRPGRCRRDRAEGRPSPVGVRSTPISRGSSSSRWAAARCRAKARVAIRDPSAASAPRQLEKSSSSTSVVSFAARICRRRTFGAFWSFLFQTSSTLPRRKWGVAGKARGQARLALPFRAAPPLAVGVTALQADGAAGTLRAAVEDQQLAVLAVARRQPRHTAERFCRFTPPASSPGPERHRPSSRHADALHPGAPPGRIQAALVKPVRDQKNVFRTAAGGLSAYRATLQRFADPVVVVVLLAAAILAPQAGRAV